MDPNRVEPEGRILGRAAVDGGGEIARIEREQAVRIALVLAAAWGVTALRIGVRAPRAVLS